MLQRIQFLAQYFGRTNSFGRNSWNPSCFQTQLATTHNCVIFIGNNHPGQRSQHPRFQGSFTRSSWQLSFLRYAAIIILFSNEDSTRTLDNKWSAMSELRKKLLEKIFPIIKHSHHWTSLQILKMLRLVIKSRGAFTPSDIFWSSINSLPILLSFRGAWSRLLGNPSWPKTSRLLTIWHIDWIT